MKKKPTATWYTTNSFTEQFSPPTHSQSLAQSSFELSYPSHSLAQPSSDLGNLGHSLAVPHLQQRETLGQLAKPMEKGVEDPTATVKRKPTAAWYITDSFTEKSSTPTRSTTERDTWSISNAYGEGSGEAVSATYCTSTAAATAGRDSHTHA